MERWVEPVDAQVAACTTPAEVSVVCEQKGAVPEAAGLMHMDAILVVFR
jgi:hypothetical protein